MKTKVLLFLLLGVNLFAASPGDDLSPDLKPVFSALVGEDGASLLVGKKYTANLRLKFASEKHLIFYDAFLPSDNGSKYQIAKWGFTPDLVRNYIGKEGIKCAVSFRVSSVNTLDKKMPYIIAEITAITDAK